MWADKEHEDPSAWALATASIGMWIGQKIRTRLSPAAFRRWFFLGLLILGIYRLRDRPHGKTKCVPDG
jgi:uncharacterized membrane protein YfcA